MRNLTPQIKSSSPSSWYDSIEAVVNIDHDSLVQYKALVNAVAPDEVQWYSMVNRAVIKNKPTLNQVGTEVWTYYVNGIFIPKQTVSAGEVDTTVKNDPSTMMCIYKEMKEKHADDSDLGFNNEALNADIQRMHVWCHSHPFSSSPSPSGTDVATFRDWVSDNAKLDLDTPTLMLIFGNADYIYAAVYDPRLPGSFFNEVPVVVSDPTNVDKSYIDAAIKSKISKRAVVHSVISPSWSKFQVQNYKYADVVASTQSEMSLEEKAMLFFTKKHSDFENNVDFINENYSCVQEVRILWDQLSTYLNGNVEQALFLRALTQTSKELEDLKLGFTDSSQITSKEEAVMVLTQWADMSDLFAHEMKSAITFVKHYSAQRDEAGRTRALAKLSADQDLQFNNSYSEWQNDYKYGKSRIL